MTFSYTALAGARGRVSGIVNAQSAGEAAAALKAEGLTPLTVKVQTGQAWFSPPRMSHEAHAEFLFSLGQMVQAGADIRSVVGMLSENARSQAETQACKALDREIAAGRAAPEAIGMALPNLPSSAVARLSAGEARGRLAEAAMGIADDLRASQNARAVFLGAVSYPMFIALASFVAALVILFVVAPSLEPLLAESRASANLVLRLLMGASAVARVGWPWALVVVAGLAVAIVILTRLGWLNSAVESALLDGPAGRMVRGLVYGPAMVTLGQLFEAGVPTPEAFQLTMGATRFGGVRKDVEAIANQVYAGVSFSDALALRSRVPPTIARMAKVGQQSGRLGEMLRRSGQLEQDRALKQLQALARALGPILIAMVGLGVGGLMAGLLATVATIGGDLQE